MVWAGQKGYPGCNTNTLDQHQTNRGHVPMDTVGETHPCLSPKLLIVLRQHFPSPSKALTWNQAKWEVELVWKIMFHQCKTVGTKAALNLQLPQAPLILSNSATLPSCSRWTPSSSCTCAQAGLRQTRQHGTCCEALLALDSWLEQESAKTTT